METAGFNEVSQPCLGDFHEYVRKHYGFSYSTMGWENMILAAEMKLDIQRDEFDWETYDAAATHEDHCKSFEAFYTLLDAFRKGHKKQAKTTLDGRIFERCERDQWTQDDNALLNTTNVNTIENLLKRGRIIMQHGYLNSSMCASVQVFDNFNSFKQYLHNYALPGDAFDVWSFDDNLKTSNSLVQAKLADDDGYTPKRGAY